MAHIEVIYGDPAPLVDLRTSLGNTFLTIYIIILILWLITGQAQCDVMYGNLVLGVDLRTTLGSTAIYGNPLYSILFTVIQAHLDSIYSGPALVVDRRTSLASKLFIVIPRL